LPLSLNNFGNKEKDASRRYLNNFENTYFFIFSDNPKKPFQRDFVLNFIKQFQPSAETVQIFDFQVEKYRFTDSEGFYHTVLFINDKNRSYVFQTVSETEKNPLTERFFSSIRLNKTPLPQNITSEDNSKDFIDQTNNTADNNAEVYLGGTGSSGIGSGRGNGVGSGSGNGSETDASKIALNDKPYVNTNSPLKILSKPKANYTDIARFYQIEGTVRVRLTFLANGEIGSAVPMTKLPFRLTEQALEAARKMKFEPAVKDGQPYSVAKIVEYSFTIY